MTASSADGFRPGEDLDPADLPPIEPDQPAPAPAGGTDLDVLIGYQLLLGRDPENSFVIAEAKNNSVAVLIRALLGSDEFITSVAEKLAAGRPLAHEASSAAPTQQQRDWLIRNLPMPADAQSLLRTAPSWRDWMRVLMAVAGVKLPSSAAPGRPAEPEAAAGAVDAGFVLITLEKPKPGDAIYPGDEISGTGWTIAPADVTEVAVLLDDTVLAHARYGLARPDVARSFPHYRHVDHCGFAFTATIPEDADVSETSQLVIRVRTVNGDEGNKTIRLLPPLTGGLPATEDAWPIRLTIEDVKIDERRVLRLRGWAASRAGLRDVVVAIGETPVGRAVTGLSRPDIALAHSSYPDADKSGFALVHGLAASLAGGPSFVRVRAVDTSGRARQAIMPVTLPPAPEGAAAADEPRLAVADEMPAAAASSGIACACEVASLCTDGRIAVGGWAVAQEGLGSILVEFDGLALGDAVLGLPRPDVGGRYPDNADAAKAGFSFAHTLPAPPSAGPHFMTLRFRGRDGRSRAREISLVPVQAASLPREATDILQEAAFWAPAAAEAAEISAKAAELRLELDRPVLDGHEAREQLTGALTVAGWAVARTGLQGVSVFFDDKLLGEAHVGMRREDIAAAFPDFPGSLLAGFALVVPPGALPPGRHRIRVVAKANPQGAAAAASTERRFSINVAPYDALPPGGEPRATLPPAELALGLGLLADADFRPRFTLAIAVSPDDPAALAALSRTLASLSDQAYPDWTARIFMPASAMAAARALPQATDPAGRIAFAAEKPGGQPKHAEAGPNYVAKLRAGDVLGVDALLELALALANDREAELLYSDELRFDPGQQRRQPFFKPDFSPELLLSMNYIGRLWCASAGALQAAGLTLETLAEAGDYDTVLRLTEQGGKIAHLPRVLCARGEAGDTSAAEAAALSAALTRRKIKGAVQPGSVATTWRVRRQLAKTRRGPAQHVAGLVSIVIPTCSARGLVRRAISSIRATVAPAMPNGTAVEIVVLDNTPLSDGASRAWLRANADKVIDMPGAFNWSRFNNAGAEAARGEYLLFLNDDIEVTQPDWLEALLEHAQRPEVGVVGARLLYPAGTVQHAGQYLADGHARHAFRFADSKDPGPFGLATVSREMISVTGACQLMHRRVFDRLQGFEEAHSIVNNDLDFCLRSWKAGLAVIYTPHATLVHHELASRAQLTDTYDKVRFTGAWRQRFITGDPFRNPHLGVDSDFYGPEPEPTVHLHVGRRLPPAGEIHSILALKLDHIGDFLTAGPALRALRERFPNAQIDLLVPGAAASLARQGDSLDPSLGVNEIIVFDFFHARSGDGQKGLSDAEYAALHARLAPAQYDMAIDLRMHPETRQVLRHTGARFLVGYDHADRFPWLDVALEWEGDVRLARKRAHVSERLVQLVSAAADACRDEAPTALAIPQTNAANEAFAGLPVRFRARPVVCIHPGVGNVVRQWPATSYAALIDLLALEARLHAVLIGSAEEVPIAEEILRRVADPTSVVSLVGRVKLAQLPALMRRCVLFVGNNSGPQHLAASVGLPTLGIHSGVVDAAEWAPLGARAMAIRRGMVCSPCYLEFASDCPRDLACLTGLQPRDVFAACRRLLAGRAVVGA